MEIKYIIWVYINHTSFINFLNLSEFKMALHLHLGPRFDNLCIWADVDSILECAHRQHCDSVSHVAITDCPNVAALSNEFVVFHVFVNRDHVVETTRAWILRLVEDQKFTLHVYGSDRVSWLCDLLCMSDSIEKTGPYIHDQNGPPKTQIKLYVGCMFAGKSTKAIRTARRLQKVGVNVLAINHKADTRYGQGGINTHDLDHLDSLQTGQLMDLAGSEIYQKAECIIIEEAQFFPDLLIFLCRARLDNKSVFVFGLDGMATRQPFGQVCQVITLADQATKLMALCQHCGREAVRAPFTTCLRQLPEDGMLIGGDESYMAVCRKHWINENSFDHTVKQSE